MPLVIVSMLGVHYGYKNIAVYACCIKFMLGERFLLRRCVVFCVFTCYICSMALDYFSVCFPSVKAFPFE
jgi:hypothetical protein